MVAALTFVVPLVLLFGYAAYVGATGGSSSDAIAGLTGEGDLRPVHLLLVNLSWAVMIPATLLLVALLHRLRPGWLVSVVGRIRWGWLLVCLPLAFVALLANVVLLAVLPIESEQVGGLNDFTSTTRDFILIIVLTTPLQAAGEEFAFRGYLLQAVAGWIGRPWVSAAVAITAQALVFAVAHGIGQSLPVFFDRFAFGVVAGLTAVLTGGLEAGIAAHVMQNFVAFAAALAFGDMTSALTATDGSWWTVPSTLLRSLVFLGLTLLVARGMRVAAQSAPVGLEAPEARV